MRERDYDLLQEIKEAIERQRKALENCNAELERLEKLLTSELDED